MSNPTHHSAGPSAENPVSHWTAAQRIAITHRRGEMVVLAGAGSGKTATLARRCAELVMDSHDPCDVRELLVLTFTRAAADEMRSRIAGAIRAAAAHADGVQARRLQQQAALVDTAQINTFHAFCLWVAKTWFMFCHLDPAFTLLNEHEAAMLLSDALRAAARRWMAEDHPRRSAFIEIFDLYAGASLSSLESLLLPVLRTMETVVDPHAWQTAAAQSGDAAVAQLVDALIKQKCRQLHELALMLAAMADDAKGFDADAKKYMYAGLAAAAAAAQKAEHLLQQEGPAGWARATDQLKMVTFATKIQLKQREDKSQAEHFKAGTYKPLKDAFKSLRKEFAVADIPQLCAVEHTSRHRISVILDFAAAVREEYGQSKLMRHQLDYSDLEHTVIAALSNSDNPLQMILHQRFRHILVDEYQDINPVQQRLIELLYRGDQPTVASLPPGSLFGVGDVLQSIYAFRGSEPLILYKKVQSLQQAGLTDKVITMRENFRTLPPLLDALNAMIHPTLQMVDSHAPPDALRMADLSALSHGRPAAAADAFIGVPVELHVLTEDRSMDQQTSDEFDATADAADLDSHDPITEMLADELEAAKIGQLILRMRGDGRKIGPDARPIEYGDIAILLRAPRQRAPHYVRTLNTMGIDASAALTTGFFASAEVLEVLDILRVLDNPEQDIALAGVLIGPVGGCTMADLALIRKTIALHLPFHQEVRRFTMQQYADGPLNILAAKISTAFEQLERWRAMLRTESLVNGLAHILRDAGLLNRAAAMIGGSQRLANVRLLQQRAVEFSGFDIQSLSRFLTFFDRLRDERDLGEAAPPVGNAVRIMSIHAAKGLEFPVVFIAALGSPFNQRDLHAPLLVDREKGLGITILDANGVIKRNSPGHMLLSEQRQCRLLQEEARLLYVAMTRARDHLVLVGRAETSAVEKWAQVPLPGAAKSSAVWHKLPGNPLDWLGPVFSQSHITGTANTLLQLHLTAETNIHADTTLHTPQQNDSLVHELFTAFSIGAPLPHAPTPDASLQATLNRIIRPYAYSALTRLPAVTTVSRLKSLAFDDPESPAHPLDANIAPPRLNLAANSSGAQTGLVIHRILQLLDWTQPMTADYLAAAITDMIQRGLISTDAALVDRQMLLWFFTTPLGGRLQTAATQATRDHQALREVSFIWSVPTTQIIPDFSDHGPGIASTAVAPHPDLESTLVPNSERTLVRGTIDALLIEPGRVEVVDYKTDAPQFIEARLPAYRRQVAYYARAASAILHQPVQQTSLVFLSARRIDTLPLIPAAAS